MTRLTRSRVFWPCVVLSVASALLISLSVMNMN